MWSGIAKDDVMDFGGCIFTDFSHMTYQAAQNAVQIAELLLE